MDMSGALNFLWALCVGAVALFAFFAVMGGFAPGDVLWLTLIVAFLAVMFVIHQVRVSHELQEHDEDDPVVREVQRIRERRGF
jgi:fatty acid desaturase